MSSIKHTIQNLPDTPGVYQYFNAQNKLLYVGKAKSLKKRVKSYWRFTPELQPNPTQSRRITMMLQETIKLEYIVVDSEEDALILENSLIKQLKPKFNILLRDDKTYPYIYIDETSPFPRFEITRRAFKNRLVSYFGPFPNGGRELLNALYEIFPLVQKSSCLKGGKACLFYQIKKCLAPCEKKVSPQEYAMIITRVKEAIFKRHILTQELENRMVRLATQERFEEAARIRDMISAIASLSPVSTIDLANELNTDLFAIRNGIERGVVMRLFMRDGKIISSSYSYFRHTHNFDENEAYKQALLEFYTVDAPHITRQIITAHVFEDSIQIAKILSDRFGQKIEISTPQKGSKHKLVTLALQNCDELLRIQPENDSTEQQIAHLLKLELFPYRIETFDNSHMMGTATVGGMVVQESGKWEKSSYRRYQLEAKDEYGQMKEMLKRRIASFEEEPAPDLWILDGGQANLNLALELLQTAKVNLSVVAIAKEKLDAKAHRAKGAAKDLLYTSKGVLELKPTDKRLQWFQRQRDEAHRYAITYHQNKKRQADTQISLLSQKGIGPATVKKLLNYFGTFDTIRNASIEDLEKVVGNAMAKRLKTFE